MLLSTGSFFGNSAVPSVGDPYFSNVVLLADFDGANNATSATDYSCSAARRAA